MVTSIEISVIVPTRNERDNVEALVQRLTAALPCGRAELIFVDDSSDDTPEAIEAAKASTWLPILSLHRSPLERKGGLGGAVVAGMRVAVGRIAVIMDGDLQHPPESIHELIRPIDSGEADLVVASRYRECFATSGLANPGRVGISRLATGLTKAAFPRRLQSVTDPMSGFFALRMAAIDVDDLRPLGFKILLETVARCQLAVAEVGFSFGPRHAGESKASLREGLRFATHLARLRASTLLSARQLRALTFASVGVTGLVVNTIGFWFLAGSAHLNYLVAAALATQLSTTWNFAGTELFVFPGKKPGSIWRRYLGFSALNNSVMLARLPFLALLVSVGHLPKFLANMFTLLAVFVVRFGISDRFIYKGDKAMQNPTDASIDVSSSPIVGPSSVPSTGPVRVTVQTGAGSGAGTDDQVDQSFRFRYDLHGIVTIGSDVALPELTYFLDTAGRAEGATAPDIAVRVGRVGRLRGRTRLVRTPDNQSMRWEEHFGRGSANFAIDFGLQIRVTSSRALARSPHVLYTNVIEALLRFVFVDRGFMLLHAACLDVGGRGVMLSARTDTGKTGTVLKLLRTTGGQFLSDDMTIMDSQGTARSFPKPLTISQHTLRAVEAGDLSRFEWAKLRVQSRLHSKEGRGFAMKLAERNLPIMTINGWVQRIVPPPKYMVQRLVPCEIINLSTVSELYIIERGVPHHSVVSQSQAVVELLENTEDAYGFPPYRYVAPVLSVGGRSYDELREKERLILISAMESVKICRLGSNNFSWSDDILAGGEIVLDGDGDGDGDVRLADAEFIEDLADGQGSLHPEADPPLTGSGA